VIASLTALKKKSLWSAAERQDDDDFPPSLMNDLWAATNRIGPPRVSPDEGSGAPRDQGTTPAGRPIGKTKVGEIKVRN
jgi:hypothetical protein